MKSLRRLALLTGLGLVALGPGVAMAGGGGGGSGGPCSGFAEGDTVVMYDNCFSGIGQFAAAGTTLVIENAGELPHSFTAVDGSFDTGILQRNGRAEIELGEAGIVRVYCTLHGTAQGQGMAGLLIVGDAAPVTAGAGSAQALSAALNGQNEALLGELAAQSQTANEIKAEIAAVNRALQASNQDSRWAQASITGLAGLLLGGAALAVAMTRRRQSAPSKQEAAVAPAGAAEAAPAD